jgi:hypothetical protein
LLGLLNASCNESAADRPYYGVSNVNRRWSRRMSLPVRVAGLVGIPACVLLEGRGWGPSEQHGLGFGLVSHLQLGVFWGLGFWGWDATELDGLRLRLKYLVDKAQMAGGTRHYTKFQKS